MPSPIAHSLMGIAVGAACLCPRAGSEPVLTRAWALRWPLLGCGLLANAPDLDFLPGIWTGEFNAFHHGYSHSLGWVLLFALAVWCLGRGIGKPWRWPAYGVIVVVLVSHLIADVVCEDPAPPYGVMLFWPVHDGWVMSPVSVFARMEKATLGAVFQPSNIGPALREFGIGLGLCGMVWGLTSWRSGKRPEAKASPCTGPQVEPLDDLP